MFSEALCLIPFYPTTTFPTELEQQVEGKHLTLPLSLTVLQVSAINLESPCEINTISCQVLSEVTKNQEEHSWIFLGDKIATVDTGLPSVFQ